MVSAEAAQLRLEDPRGPHSHICDLDSDSWVACLHPVHVASLSSRVALQRAKTEAPKASSGLVLDIKQHPLCGILFVKASHRASLYSKTRKIDSFS